MHSTFPFSRVFVLGIILFLLGLASMIISVIAFVIQSWGHYAGTGMWSGSIILASGLTAVFVSHLKSEASVKTLCVFSVIATFASLAMLVLSAGGLTLNSGFYSHISPTDYSKRTSNVIHASLLVISVFCLSGSILSVIVCCKYLIFDHHGSAKHSRHSRGTLAGRGMANGNLRGGATSSVTTRPASSRTPLCTTDNPFRRHSDNLGLNRVQIEYRRSHRRSASDQPQSNPPPRRYRYSQLDPINDSPTMTPPHFDFHNCMSIRDESNRRSSQDRELGKHGRERTDTIPLLQISSQPSTQVQLQDNLLRSPGHQLSAQTLQQAEFIEDQPPAYDALESSTNALTHSPHLDSGDESDMENSSNTEVYVTIATNVQEQTARATQSEINNSQTQDSSSVAEASNLLKTPNITTYINSSCLDNNSNTASFNMPIERQNHDAVCSGSQCELTRTNLSCNTELEAAVLRRATNRTSLLSETYVNTQFLEKDDLTSAATETPKTGEIPGPELGKKHLQEEHVYENNPRYENLLLPSASTQVSSMNHLSKPTSLDLTNKPTTASSVTSNDKDTDLSVKKTPVQIVASPGLNMSPQRLQNNFDLVHSAFKPVGAASNILSPQDVLATMSQSSLLFSSTNGNNETQESAPHIYINTNLLQRRTNSASTDKSASNSTDNHISASNSTDKYIEQGAIPKTAKHREKALQSATNGKTSWKNLPFSYNHSQSAFDEPEKKLPSKTIPFTNSDQNVLSAILEKKNPLPNSLDSPEFNLAASRHSGNNFAAPISLPLSVLSPSSNQSLLLAGSSVKASSNVKDSLPVHFTVNHSPEAVTTQPKQMPNVYPAAVSRGIKTSSFKEASTQVNSGSINRWFSHRTGASQTQQLQKKQEEHPKSQVVHRALGGGGSSSRTARPSSMPVSSGICHGISGLATDKQFRNRFSASFSSAVCPDSMSPLSPSASLLSHIRQPTQSAVLHQNVLTQHYPLQPQQPRLGVQLHQRRHQQHQLQHNIESQQQHQQQHRHHQLIHQPQPQGAQSNHPAQQGRNGRPLFSVLL